MGGGHQRPDTPWGRGSAEPLAPIRGDPPTATHPLDKGRLGAGGGCMLFNARDPSSRDYFRVYHNPRCFSTPPLPQLWNIRALLLCTTVPYTY